MADVQENRTVQNVTGWKKTTENTATGIATVETPGRANSLTGLPSKGFNDAQKQLVEVSGFNNLFANHNVVNVEGHEYPERFIASVPAGKTLNLNAGQRPLVLKDGQPANKKVFHSELPDDIMFIDVAEGATLNLKADQTKNKSATVDLKSPTNVNGPDVAYTLGGRNFAAITGKGTVNIDMGVWSNNTTVQAKKSTASIGSGNSIYTAYGESEGHTATGAAGAQIFEYNFDQNWAAMPTSIGANKFDGKPGDTNPVGGIVDQVQLRNLPAGYKVDVNVTRIQAGGTLPDADFKVTIKKPDGTSLGTIEAKDMSVLHLINSSTQSIQPSQIGVGNTRTYTIGG